MIREFRKKKIENLLAREIGALILNGSIKDPRVHKFLTVVRVEIANDLIDTKVFISSLNQGTSLDIAIVGLNSAKGFIQSELAKKIRLKNTPKLRFIKDTSLEDAFYVNYLIDHEIKN